MRFAASVDIDATPELVWQVLTDVERWPEWTETMRRVERLDSGPFALGSTVRIEQPRLRPAIWLVTELTPGSSFSWTSTSGGVTTVAGHRLVAAGPDRVRVELTIAQRGVLAPLVGLLAGPTIRRYLRTEAAGLKRRCEQSASERAAG